MHVAQYDPHKAPYYKMFVRALFSYVKNLSFFLYPFLFWRLVTELKVRYKDTLI